MFSVHFVLLGFFESVFVRSCDCRCPGSVPGVGVSVCNYCLPSFPHLHISDILINFIKMIVGTYPVASTVITLFICAVIDHIYR